MNTRLIRASKKIYCSPSKYHLIIIIIKKVYCGPSIYHLIIIIIITDGQTSPMLRGTLYELQSYLLEVHAFVNEILINCTSIATLHKSHESIIRGSGRDQKILPENRSKKPNSIKCVISNKSQF